MKKLAILSIGLMLAATTTNAQNAELSTEGTNFWLTFLPNYHAESRTGSYVRTDSIHIYISSKTTNKGTIKYTTGNQTFEDKTINWSLPQPNTIYHVTLPYTAALRGYHNAYEEDNPYQSETISPKTFHITADSNCSVYALDYAEKSAEAFIVIPQQTLGTEYIINTYNAHKLRSAKSATPSQFAIVAPNDNTKISVVPTDTTNTTPAGDTTYVTLNQGEVFLVQSNINQNYADLTGSQILADKPIAVFAGHQRAAIPKEFNGNPSRDCLIEQQLPVNTWGRRVVITPFTKTAIVTGNAEIDAMPGIYRVVAAQNGTNIYENNDPVATLNRGQFYEANLKPALISANRPIAVTAFMPSATDGRDGQRQNPHGDPSMVAIPPVEQFKTELNVVNAQIKGPRQANMFQEQYITIIAPIATRNNISIDGQLIAQNTFTQISNTTFMFANIQTTDGQHIIKADLPIAAIIYGYGAHVSYGYLGGMAFYDLTNTAITKPDSCLNSATWTYNTAFTTAIDKYEITAQQNCNITEQQFDHLMLELQLTKVDTKKPAYFSITITDTYGEVTTLQSDTIQAYNLTALTADTLGFGQQPVGSLNNQNFNLINTGSLPIELDTGSLQLTENTNFTIGKASLNKTLAPGDSTTITLFYAPTNADKTTQDSDTLTLTALCNKQQIILTGQPTKYYSNATGECNLPILLAVDSINVNKTLQNEVTNSSLIPVMITSQNLTIQLTTTTTEHANAIFYNTLGQQVKKINLGQVNKGTNDISIDTAQLPQGLYFILLTYKKL